MSPHHAAKTRAHKHLNAMGQLISELEIADEMKDALRMRLRDLWSECKAAMSEPKETL